MPDRVIILATNGRHGLRGLSQVTPQEFTAYQEEDDDLTYVADLAAYGEGATVSSVTRTANGVTVSNTSATSTRITQRLKGFGFVDIAATMSSGDVDSFRINIIPRSGGIYGARPQDYQP